MSGAEKALQEEMAQRRGPRVGARAERTARAAIFHGSAVQLYQVKDRQ